MLFNPRTFSPMYQSSHPKHCLKVSYVVCIDPSGILVYLWVFLELWLFQKGGWRFSFLCFPCCSVSLLYVSMRVHITVCNTISSMEAVKRHVWPDHQHCLQDDTSRTHQGYHFARSCMFVYVCHQSSCSRGGFFFWQFLPLKGSIPEFR